MGARSSDTPLLPQQGIRRHSRLKLEIGISDGYFYQIHQLYSFFFGLDYFGRKFSFRRDERNNSCVNLAGEGINCDIGFLSGFHFADLGFINEYFQIDTGKVGNRKDFPSRSDVSPGSILRLVTTPFIGDLNSV